MTEWPEDWHPRGAAEAQEYVDAHEDGSGDPELLIECEALLEPQRRPTQRPGIPSGTKTSPFPELPEELTEEKGAD